MVEVNGCGGSLLHMLLEGTGNFVENNPRSMTYPQSFFDLENRLSSRAGCSTTSRTFIARKKLSEKDGRLG